MRRNSLTGLLACAVALPGIAGQPPATTAGPMEEVMTMRVEGSLAVDAIGNVIAHQVDTKLDPKLQGLVEVAIATWSFMPPTVDGKPATAKSDMRITLAGRKIGEGYEVKVDNVVFFDRKREELTPAALEEKRAALGITSLNFVQMNPRPKYPGFHVNGIVMISVLARPDGTVERAFASHCSLYLARGSKADLSRACKAMQDNGVSAVRHWKVSVDVERQSRRRPGNLTGVLPLFYKMRGDEEIRRHHQQRARQLAPGMARCVSRSTLAGERRCARAARDGVGCHADGNAARHLAPAMAQRCAGACAVRRVLGVALASLLSAAALFAQAQQPARIELDVVGELTIDTDGSVRDYAIGSPLPKEVVAAVGTAVKRWRFSPVVRDGRAVTAKTPMYLLLSATQEAAGYRMRVDRVQFGVGRELASARGFHHAYPRDAMRSRQGAQVLVALRIDGAGKVLEAVPLRSRLVPRVTNAKQSARQRAQFEDAVVGMMAQAKFQPADPAKGEPEQAHVRPAHQLYGQPKRSTTVVDAGRRRRHGRHAACVAREWARQRRTRSIARRTIPRAGWRAGAADAPSSAPPSDVRRCADAVVPRQKTPRNAGRFLSCLEARLSASSIRRTRRWTWCSSSCRAGIPSRRSRPSDGGVCAGSRSSAAGPDR
jgi:hypothetical protein